MNKSLLEVCNITTGKLDSNAATENGKYPFFTCAPVPLKIDSYDFDDDVILLAGNNAQGNFHISRYTGKFNAYQRTYIITAREDFNIDYIKYSIEMALNHFKKISQGSQTKFLTMAILEQFTVENIPLEQQKQKVACLVALDKKISINKKINATLEDMAETLYLHLFFRRSPNGKLGDLITENTKSTIPVGDAKDSGGNFPFFTSGENILRWNEYLVDGRNIFMNTGGNAGINFYIGKAAYSTDTWCITAKNLTDYLYLFLDTIKIEIGKKYFKGTALKHLQKDLLRKHEIYIPSAAELEEFSRFIQPCFDMIGKKLRENYQLAETRDFLLPLLMNGQVGFKED